MVWDNFKTWQEVWMLADLNHVAEEESWCRRSQVEAQPGIIIEASKFVSFFILNIFCTSTCPRGWPPCAWSPRRSTRNRKVSEDPWPPVVQAPPFNRDLNCCQTIISHLGISFVHLLGGHPERSDAGQLQALRCERLREEEPVQIIYSKTPEQIIHCKTPAQRIKRLQKVIWPILNLTRFPTRAP